MTEKDVMFRVLYNPNTKEVYTNPGGDVYEFNSISGLKTAIKNYPDIKNAMDNGYEVFAVVENYTPILNSTFDDVFHKHYAIVIVVVNCFFKMTYRLLMMAHLIVANAMKDMKPMMCISNV